MTSAAGEGPRPASQASSAFPPPFGVLNVDKPAGWTSFDVVAFVRRRGRVRRVGHAGTLDPAATGVLPVLIGQATRFAEHLMDATKVYDAEIELGLATDTYDAEGTVLHRADATHVRREDVEAALARFRGEIEQAPPPFSAVKRGGVPLYVRARRGEAVAAAPRRVRCHRLEINSYEPPRLRVRVECGKGFYVRSLAHDLGEVLGVGGCLTALRRTRVGPFRVEDAVGIEELAAEMESGAWRERLLPPDELLLGWRAAILGEESSRALRQGRPLRLVLLPSVTVRPGERCRAYNVEGEFLGLLRRAEGALWRPEKVLAPG